MILRGILGAAFLLVAGTAVYLLARPEPAWFVPVFLFAPIQLASGIGGSFPTFAHSAALSLVTACVLGGSRRDALSACIAWTLANLAFEIGQHPIVRAHLARSLPDWFERVWLLDRTGGYFMNGTFDYADIAAALLGGTVALALIETTRIRGGHQ